MIWKFWRYQRGNQKS